MVDHISWLSRVQISRDVQRKEMRSKIGEGKAKYGIVNVEK